MLTLLVYNREGEEVGSVEVDPAEFGGKINRQLLHDVVLMYEANRRVGTVRTKGRGDVQGSKKKMYRQKGTGNARMGNKRTGKRRGGGATFARTPKDWSYRLPKQAVRSALRMALLSKFQDNQALVLDDLQVAEVKTREVAGVLKKLKLDGLSCLLTIAEHDPILWKSARNIEGLRVSPARDLNAYDVLRQKRLVLTRGALEVLRGQGGAAEN